MHIITILYPTGDSTRFDMDYYTGTHMPMFADRIGTDNMVGWGAAAMHGDAYHCVAWATVRSLEKYQAAMGEYGAEIIADVANYTDARPVLLTGDIAAMSD